MARKRIPKKIRAGIQQYITALQKEDVPLDCVILFGSYAKGKQNRWSDVDLCIVSPLFKNSFNALQFLWTKRLRDSGVRIEPVGFHPRDFSDRYDSLINEIRSTGISIPIRKLTRVNSVK
ncbi:nucleotidyltransferase domain-containing protein [Candidatus Uhrbacteria bacterium]|nr:nucleotidyltransferase domain-containing protein [Candidatus Uhrbacteria bacterium]